MGFLDELKKLTHPYDDDDDDFFGSASDDQPSSEEGAGAAERRSSFFPSGEEAAPESYGCLLYTSRPIAARCSPGGSLPASYTGRSRRNTARCGCRVPWSGPR